MRLNFITIGQSLLALTAAQAGHPAPIFRPQSGGLTSGISSLPLAYNLSATHSSRDPSALGSESYWITSFVHGSNSHDYMVLSNVIFDSSVNLTLYRASILDITDPNHFSEYERIAPRTTNLYNNDGIFDASFPGYGFGSSSSADPLSELHAYSSINGTQFDLTLQLSAPVLLNGGLGSFEVNGKPGFQWSMPAGRTRGWILADGHNVTVDPARSLTWYDRQWGSFPERLSWFEIHLPGNCSDASADEVFSIWTFRDTVRGNTSFATSRLGTSMQEQRVVPVMWPVTSNRTFVSPTSNVSWPLDWSIEIQGGPALSLSSVRPNQETTGLLKVYTGYVNINATYPDGRTVSGYGVAETLIS